MNKPNLYKKMWRIGAAIFVMEAFIAGGFVMTSVYADASPSPSPIEITNNNNNTNNNTNNNNINITNPMTVSALRKVSVGGGQATASATTKGGVEATSAAMTKGGLKETPQTGAGTVAIAGLFGVGVLGVYMARYKKGLKIQEAIEENMGELGSIYVDLRSALKRNA